MLRLRALSSVSHRIALQTTSRLEKDTMPDGFIEKKAFSFIVRGANLALTEHVTNYLHIYIYIYLYIIYVFMYLCIIKTFYLFILLILLSSTISSHLISSL